MDVTGETQAAAVPAPLRTRPRVFVSVPDDRHLDSRRRRLKRSIIEAITTRGIDVTAFEPEQLGDSIPANLENWTAEKAGALIKRCDGALILALGRNRAQIFGNDDDPAFPTPGPVLLLPTAYNHLEGALALAEKLPLFILVEEGMEWTGIFGSGTKVVVIPGNADETWSASPGFQLYLPTWQAQLNARRDVFLGYCSKASTCAYELRDFIEANGFTVVDWARDFKPAGATILEEIERAARRCRTAVFLFTKDDELEEKATSKATFDAIPRDNVLLEAGYFTQARGKERVAIVREDGAKIPADFGGIIYLSLQTRNDLSTVKPGLLRFLNDILRNPIQPGI